MIYYYDYNIVILGIFFIIWLEFFFVILVYVYFGVILMIMCKNVFVFKNIVICDWVRFVIFVISL